MDVDNYINELSSQNYVSSHVAQRPRSSIHSAREASEFFGPQDPEHLYFGGKDSEIGRTQTKVGPLHTRSEKENDHGVWSGSKLQDLIKETAFITRYGNRTEKDIVASAYENSQRQVGKG